MLCSSLHDMDPWLRVLVPMELSLCSATAPPPRPYLCSRGDVILPLRRVQCCSCVDVCFKF